MNRPVFDDTTLPMLESLLGEDFPNVLETFLDDAPRRLAVLEQALAEGDLPGMERAAHTLKGAASNLGAVELTECCAELVRDCRAGAAPQAEFQVSAIRASLARVEEILRARLEKA